MVDQSRAISARHHLALPLLAVLAACAAPDAWHVDVALRAGEKLGGCAAGDLLADRPGTELVAVAGSGAVRVVFRDADGWHSQTVFRAPGEVIQCAAGEVDPARPGDEIVAVGMAAGPESGAGPGAAYLIFRDGDSWHGKKIFEDPRLLHGACITGQGIFVIGFSNKVFQIRRSGDGFDARPVADLPGAGKTCVATKDGIAIACNDGSLVLLSGTDGTFAARVLDKRSQGRARVGTDGHRVVVADDDGTLSLVSADGREQIHKEDMKLRGAVLADLDPETPGLEAACAGYAKKITVLSRQSGGWRKAFEHQEPGRLHHLIAADLDGRPGLELAACGFAGRLVVLSRASTGKR
ncbi:MAG: hypothetical protein ACYTGW_16630 [Planctomycetota bacterium]|jgi:hypothetical protein